MPRRRLRAAARDTSTRAIPARVPCARTGAGSRSGWTSCASRRPGRSGRRRPSSAVLDRARPVAELRRGAGRVLEAVTAVRYGRPVVRIGHARADAVAGRLVREPWRVVRIGRAAREIEARKRAAPARFEGDGFGFLLDRVVPAVAIAGQVDLLRHRATP